ncbi:MAG: dCTP deaminase domain-containing protein, partial [Gemmataceae bacterium]
MGVLPDWMIERDVKIEPFVQASPVGAVSYGVTSYGYDVRVARNFKVFTNARCAIVDPKNFDVQSFVDIEGDHCLIPPNSFALAETVEYIEVPRDIICVCVGKCVTGDTRVVDADTGDYMPIKEFIARKAARTVALDGLKLADAAVSDHRHSGLEPVYRLTTRTGLTIKATAAHPFRTLDGWRELRDLAPGDRVAVARSCPAFGSEDWPEHEAVLMGLLLADGQCRTPGSSPRYTTGDPRLAEAFTDAARSFGMDVSPVGRMGNNLVNRRGRGGVITPNRASAWLRSHGCDRKSVDKAVPAVVFRARRERVAAFLRALFSGDGSSYTSKSKRGTTGLTLEYASSSEELIRGVRHLLLRFGIFSFVRQRPSVSGRTAYRVQINDPDMLRRFRAEVGFIPGSMKQSAFDANLAQLAPGPRRRSNFDTLPEGAWSRVVQAVRSANRSLLSLGGRVNVGQSVSLALAERVAGATADPALAELASSDVVWDTVASIVPAGVEAVYDLTVPGPSSFLANDIPIHNSTYARCGIIVNVTPLEPEWKGKVTIEISNTTPLPAKIYAGE